MDSWDAVVGVAAIVVVRCAAKSWPNFIGSEAASAYLNPIDQLEITDKQGGHFVFDTGSGAYQYRAVPVSE